MRIFLLGRNRIGKKSWGLDLFARALVKQHDVIYCGKDHNIDFNGTMTVPEMLRQYRQKIDLIVSYLGYTFYGLEQIADIPKVHFFGDYGKSAMGIHNTENYDRYLISCKNDMIISSTLSIRDLARGRKLAPIIHHLPFGVDTYLFYDRGVPRDIDVMASFTSRRDLYPHRKDVQKLIKHMGIRYFVGSVDNWKYIDMMNRSKMFANSSPMLKITTHKCLEAMACGTFLFTNKLDDMESYGYVDGENLVVYDGMDDLKQKIQYYMKHEDERNEIAKKGMLLVRENYSNERMVERFTEMVTRDIFGGKAR